MLRDNRGRFVKKSNNNILNVSERYIPKGQQGLTAYTIQTNEGLSHALLSKHPDLLKDRAKLNQALQLIADINGFDNKHMLHPNDKVWVPDDLSISAEEYIKRLQDYQNSLKNPSTSSVSNIVSPKAGVNSITASGETNPKPNTVNNSAQFFTDSSNTLYELPNFDITRNAGSFQDGQYYNFNGTLYKLKNNAGVSGTDASSEVDKQLNQNLLYALDRWYEPLVHLKDHDWKNGSDVNYDDHVKNVESHLGNSDYYTPRRNYFLDTFEGFTPDNPNTMVYQGIPYTANDPSVDFSKIPQLSGYSQDAENYLKQNAKVDWENYPGYQRMYLANDAGVNEVVGKANGDGFLGMGHGYYRQGNSYFKFNPKAWEKDKEQFSELVALSHSGDQDSIDKLLSTYYTPAQRLSQDQKTYYDEQMKKFGFAGFDYSPWVNMKNQPSVDYTSTGSNGQWPTSFSNLILNNSLYANTNPKGVESGPLIYRDGDTASQENPVIDQQTPQQTPQQTESTFQRGFYSFQENADSPIQRYYYSNGQWYKPHSYTANYIKKYGPYATDAANLSHYFEAIDASTVPTNITYDSDNADIKFGNAVVNTETGGETGAETDSENGSFGMNWLNREQNSKKFDWKKFRLKASDMLETTRAALALGVNNKMAERALEAEKPFLQDVVDTQRPVYGDYRSKIEGEQAAARLRNQASKPLTSDGALHQQAMLDAQIKGQQFIDQGNAKDEALIRQTKEVALQQAKEVQAARQEAAMQNRKAMLQTQANKTNIENQRDSVNFSSVISPVLQAQEHRSRVADEKVKQYQQYYDSALNKQAVWNTFTQDLTEAQNTLRKIYLQEGLSGVQKYIQTHGTEVSEQDWYDLRTIMQNEEIRRQAALHGVTLDPDLLRSAGSSGRYGIFGLDGGYGMFKKQGGTIYKAKLAKRSKDSDRTQKSIESSKKLANKLLEKAIDSLYDYSDIDIVAKKSRKRKYQSGGGIPFVNISPVITTPEDGAPAITTKKDSGKDDLTSKDLLELLKEMDGLPTDMQEIVTQLQNFQLAETMDPLGLSTSSDIESRYLSVINRLKIAKFNKEEYNHAFDQLKQNGGLNELAVTSDGFLVGTNAEGDFQYFTPEQVNAGEPKKEGYSLLTNSNLLYLRANSPNAAFNHQLTTFAQNGIGMQVITQRVNEILQELGTDSDSQKGVVRTGSKGSIKEGIKFLQKAAEAAGDDSITDNMSIADYYQAGYLNKNQARQAQQALQYIWSALPENAKALLQVKGGSAKGAEALISMLVSSKTDIETKFEATPKKLLNTGSSSSGSGNNDLSKLTLTPVQMMQVGYTDTQTIVLQKGTKYATVVQAQVLPITDVNKKLLGVTTLDKVAESTFGGVLDMNNATMGSQLIDPQGMQNVQVDSTNLYVMNLPIDKNSPDGTIKPDLAWMTKIEEIDKVIRDQGITDIDQINQLYVQAGLPVLMNDNGELNTNDYCKFGVLNGHALDSAFRDSDSLDNTVVEIDDEKAINNIMRIINKGRSDKDRAGFDSESWWDSIFGGDHDSMYEGTIYIPIRTNAFSGMIGGGQYPDVHEAEEIEALIQQKERTKGYVDPGLLME